MLIVLWQAKSTVSFSLEDKHVVNSPHMVHFNVSCDWFKTNSRQPKRYSEGDKSVAVYWEEEYLFSPGSFPRDTTRMGQQSYVCS